MRISPSLLAFDQLHLRQEIAELAAAGADMLHIDVMDGHFVGALTFGLPLIGALKQEITEQKYPLLLDVHLMVSNPAAVVAQYAAAGADRITFHLEAAGDHSRTLAAIREFGCQAGLALNPSTSLESIYPYADVGALDIIIVMAVQAGAGGQKFIPATLDRLVSLRAWLQKRTAGISAESSAVGNAGHGGDKSVEIAVDGGINLNWCAKLAQSGADTLVVGTALAASGDRRRDIALFRQSTESTRGAR